MSKILAAVSRKSDVTHVFLLKIANCLKCALLVQLAMPLVGCSLPVITSKYPEGNIIVLPINDAQSYGAPSYTASNSGKYFQTALVNRIGSKGGAAQAYISSSTNPDFSSYSAKEAAAVGRRLGFKYALIAQLGVFRDAVPMTFEDDFIMLSDAQLIDTSSAISVWSIAAPHRVNGGSPGNIYPLLDDAAVLVARSIISNFQVGTTYRSNLEIGSPRPQTNSSEISKQAERLRLLKRLHAEGALTDAEFQQKKAAVLDEL